MPLFAGTAIFKILYKIRSFFTTRQVFPMTIIGISSNGAPRRRCPRPLFKMQAPILAYFDFVNRRAFWGSGRAGRALSLASFEANQAAVCRGRSTSVRSRRRSGGSSMSNHG